MAGPRTLKVDAVRWNRDPSFREEKLEEARRWARSIKGVVKIVLEGDKNKEVRATIDARGLRY